MKRRNVLEGKPIMEGVDWVRVKTWDSIEITDLVQRHQDRPDLFVEKVHYDQAQARIKELTRERDGARAALEDRDQMHEQHIAEHKAQWLRGQARIKEMERDNRLLRSRCTEMIHDRNKQDTLREQHARIKELEKALEIAITALNYDRGRTINPDNAMEFAYRQSLVQADALKKIKALKQDGEK
ncbi:MAG TPA: hypothetical protein VEF04_09515 [Blastocatellia bacterium]|nr:hypothetical protein [Blastocatellia bacterium]